MASTKAPGTRQVKENNLISSLLSNLSQESKTGLPYIAPIIAPHSDDEAYSDSSDGSTPRSFEELAPTDEFEHLFMTEPDHTERNEYYSEVDDATSHTVPQKKNKYPAADSNQSFTFDDIPPSRWH